PAKFLIAQDKGPTDPRLTQTFNQQRKLLQNLLVNYKNSVGESDFSIMIGMEGQNFYQSGFNAFRRYFISEVLPELFAGSQTDWSNGGSSARGARASYFSRANYSYKDKYLLE